MRAAEAAVRVLAERGVRYAFTVPGESFLGLLDAFSQAPEIRLISTRHEGGAAFMAEAVGKLTGTPAICMGTRGVGAANLTIGIHTAAQDSSPLIALLGQVETPFRHRGAFQEVELAPFLGQLTKWSVEVPSSDRLPDLVSEGYRRSVAGRPGPVALAVPGDHFDGEAPDALPPPTAPAGAAPPPAAIAAALALLQGAERPLLIAGSGVLRGGATRALVAFAERTGLPVMSAFRRHDVFPNDHPLYLGSLSLGAPACIPARARAADVILAVGTRLGETTTFGYSIPSPGTALIHVDADPEVIGRGFPARIAIAAGAADTATALLAAADRCRWPDRAAGTARDRAAFEAATTPPAAATVDRLVDPGLVIAALQQHLPADAVITNDAGNFYGWLARYFRFRQPGTYLGPVSGAMGYAVPAAIAAALVHDNRVPVVALAGDGGFLLTLSPLKQGDSRFTARRHGIGRLGLTLAPRACTVCPTARRTNRSDRLVIATIGASLPRHDVDFRSGLKPGVPSGPSIGGSFMTGSELAVAAQYGLKLTCIVFNNAMYGTIRMHQERIYPNRVAGTELWSPDFVRYAEAFGGLGIRIAENADIADGIRAALAYPGISLLEIAVARESIAVGQSLAGIQEQALAG